MVDDREYGSSDIQAGENEQTSYQKTFGNDAYGLFYVVGFLIYIFHFGFIIFDRDLPYTGILPYFAIFIFSIGFSLWASPVIDRIRQIYIVKIIFGFIYASIAILAIIPARDLTAHVLSLPPQDFDLTVAILSLIFYVFIWAHAALIFLPAFVLLSLLFSLFLTPVSAIAKLSKKYVTKGNNLDNLRLRAFLHSIGALGFAAILWEVVYWDYKSNRLVDEAVRAIAYHADFHKIENHPGLASDRKMHIHSNGVVSYITKNEYRIETVTFNPTD